jgi:hypothetical protein
MFPAAQITVINLLVRGADWFEQEEKRLVRVRFSGGGGEGESGGVGEGETAGP